ncbi:MAG TPA: TlpA disulfide reductase family protein [Lacunisphaera sp.]|nr:TlpA disulfide reductase family protein [Lacunisphaera sp.]
MKRFLGLILTLACVALLPAAPGVVTRDAVVDRPSPALTLKDLDGKKVSLESFKGKVVIVDFWATWCEPCKTEIPGYIELQKKYGAEGLVVIGVSLDKLKPAAVKKFADNLGMNYTVVIGQIEDLDKFGADPNVDVVLPTTYLINRAGRIVHEKSGLMDHAKYEAIVKSAL